MVHYNRNIKLLLIFVLPVISFLLGWNLSLHTFQGPSSDENPESTQKLQDVVISKTSNFKTFLDKQRKEKEVDLSIFWEAWHQLESNYLKADAFNTKDQIYGATKGLIDSLEDPYTVFMTPTESVEFENAMSGEFEGIGAEIGIRDGSIVIITPLKGSPAETSGLRAGDVVFKIDEKSTQGMNISEAVTLIRGPKGEKVELTVIREGEDEPLKISIVRDNIILKAIEWNLENEILTVEISQFGNTVLSEFRAFLSEALLLEPKGMILDLRNNGGGLLDSAVEIISEFLENVVIVKTEGGQFGNTAEIMARRGGGFLDIPLVVLINKGSASASEILAGAVQDHKRALLIGETSFGKGTVQNLIPLSDGSSLKVTMAEWLTPLGRSIHESGITPDIEIERTSQDYENDRDPVMDEALRILGNPAGVRTRIQEAFEDRQTNLNTDQE